MSLDDDIQLDFSYNGSRTIIQTKKNEKMSEVYKKFKTKIGIDKDFYYLYDGGILNNDLTISEIAKEKKGMNIVVQHFDDDEETPKDSIIKSKYIICPKCKENSRLKVKNYKISLFECKNGDSIDNILLNDYNKTQSIDLANIICNNCKTNKNNTYNNKFFTCFNCKIDLCPLCKNNHDKTHNIIDYDDKNYKCNIHNENFNSYCNTCKKNICIYCESEHKNHKLILFGPILLDTDNINRKLSEFKEKIDKSKDYINEKIKSFNTVINYFELYYNLYEDIIKN